MGKKMVKKETGAKPKSKVRTRPKSRITHSDIARRAYEIYLERDDNEGTPEEDWYKAEEDLFSDPGI